jgi:hypothetical protein
MPGNPTKLRRPAGVLLLATTAVLYLAAGATAAPTPKPSDDPCELVAGAAKDICESGGSGGHAPSVTPSNPLDPLSSLAQGCAKAAAYVVDALSGLVNETTHVDFTNTSFLRQYAVVFAASTILTLILWLLAVAKRAVRGVPFTEAVTEAVGFLWLVVLASAFTPLILYTVVTATDGITDALSSGTQSNTDAFFGTFSEALKKGQGIGGGPIMLIVVSLISVLAAGVLYLELVVRAALLYAGALLGTAVYAGLVDKNLWKHVRRWAGLMIAVILVKPVIVVVLGLAGALAGDDGPTAFSADVSGLAIIRLAIFASAMIYRFVPGFGDEIVAQRGASADAASSRAVAAVSSPAHLLRQGISTHGARSHAPATGGAAVGGGSGGGGPARPANPASGGVAAHGTRPAKSGGLPPAPRGADQTGAGGARTPHSDRSTSGGDRG